MTQFAEPFTPSFFKKLQQLRIRTRKALLGSRQGSHISKRRGHGLEFADYRQYTAGDDYRHIDWGVFGRTDRVYVREFRAEQDLNVLVILDASASMAFPEGADKFELSRNLALSLGYVALSDGDTVSFAVLGKKMTPKYVGPRALSRIVKELRSIEPAGSVNIVSEVRAAAARQKLPARCFFISDFLFDTEAQIEALDHLRARNFDISVIQVLAPSEIHLDAELAGMLVDSETGETLEVALDKASQREYAVKLAEHVENLERYCRRFGIGHVLLSSDEDLVDIVLTRFPDAALLK